MSRNRLKGVMVAHGDRQSDLAEAIGVSPSCLNHKINGKNGKEFRESEIKKIADRYDMSPTEVFEIFFA